MTAAPVNAGTDAAAQQWFARLLAPDCSDAERAAFERWRAADPAHAAAYRHVESVWERSAGLREDPAIAAALQDALRPARPRRRDRAEWWPSLAAAASVTLVAAAALLWVFWPAEVPVQRYATALGEQRTVVLEDGSQLVLDTDTEVLARFARRERGLTLQRGQADFTVQPDAQRPFVVHAAGASVTATGTRFQVRVGEGGGTVTLLEGEVIVATRSGAQRESATLAPSERIEIGADGTLARKHALPEEQLAGLRGWTEGNLVVNEWSLGALVAEMNRYSDTKLRMVDPALSQIPISGVFKAGDQQSFALALEYGWSIHAEQRADAGEIVLSRK
ncbi:FecR domain-containing protein [Luteimonas sp. BDR2-5]|uniref:FecR family protein n=1 Tax=Proluteimonas luteida TaxID=2878685 RepID=UPI001E643C4F|nr:FecR domain-containing protein [Luteimonas sp. BDR2-5]MCD9026626.1 FecR domain-containing protein [Luteimonas sp. BDR2-5]